MSARNRRLARGTLAVYRRLLRLLPRDFQNDWLEEAEFDIEATLDRESSRIGIVLAGATAAWDLIRAIPREWSLAAGRSMGGARARDGRSFGESLRSGLDDVRVAARSLAQRPGFTTVAALTLGLGIGANAAIFAVVHAVLLRPLPYAAAEGLVSIGHHAPGLNLSVLKSSPGMLRFYWERADFLTALAAYDVEERNFVAGDLPERVDVLRATPELFEVLGVQPSLGRAFRAEDASPGALPVAVLTHAFWVTRFGADPEVLGRSLRLDDVRTEVVGVMPRGFAFPDADPGLLTPMYVDPEGAFGAFGTSSLARLAPGISVAEAARRAQALQAAIPDFFGGDPDAGFLERALWSVSVTRLQDELVGEELASTLWVVLGTVALVLLIACANVANLFLVRAQSRRKELAVRAAIGAGHRRIAAAFLSEALVVGLLGGVLGLVLAAGAIELLVAYGPVGVPRLDQTGVDAAALGFTAIVSVVTALLVGAFPSFLCRPARHLTVLRGGERGSTAGREHHRTRNILVAGQLALALVLLVASGLMLRSFAELRAVDPGFDPSNVVAVGISLGENVGEREAAVFYQRVVDEVAALPGVSAVGLGSSVPLAGGGANGGSFYIESRPREEDALPPVAMYKAIGGDYLRALRQRLVEGRALSRSDWESGTPVALVNQTFADRYFEGDALGERIKWGEDRGFATIVGVVSNVRELRIQTEADPWAYLPLVVEDWGYPSIDRAFLLVRTSEETAPPVPAVREIVERLNPAVPLTSVRTMEEVVSSETASSAFTLVLLATAAGMALFLGGIGLYGVASYVAGQRTREIGVRVALGARGRDIQSMVVRQGALTVAVGVVLGLLAAVGLSRLMGSLLYEVSTADPMSFLVAPVVLSAVALTAIWLPARRVSRISPVEALRPD